MVDCSTMGAKTRVVIHPWLTLLNASADMVDYNLSIMFPAKESCGNYLQIQVPPTSNHPFWWKDNNRCHKVCGHC
jgi:hypothetical protein